MGKRYGPKQPGDIFMFYEQNTGKKDKKTEVVHAILNPQCFKSESHLVAKNCVTKPLEKRCMLEYFVRNMNSLDEKQIHKPNPTMIKLGDETKYIVFTAMKRQRSERGIKDGTDRFKKIKDIHYPTIFFHGLKENHTVWEIFGGEIFIDAVPNKDPDKPFDVYYLTNEIWQDQDKSSLIKECANDELRSMYYNECENFINIVRFKTKPLNLEKRKDKAPQVKTQKEYKISFC